jgi:AtzE family amidohydrolase
MNGETLLDAGVHAIAQAVRAGRVSAVSIVRAALARIAAHDARIRAVHTTFDARALASAQHIDDAVRTGVDPGPLAGVPFLVKSNFDVAGYTTIAGSPVRLTMPAAQEDAALVRRLCSAGAVPIGATHMDEFACGATGVNPHFGAVHLPADPARMTGGSSSGSAAAVAAGYVPLALGSDTNGSIRAPAALCGVWAIKPGNGQLDLQGCVPYAPSLDVGGGFARSFADLSVMHETLCGQPVSEQTSYASPRAAVLTGAFARYSTTDVERAVQRASTCFGHVEEIAIDEQELADIREAAVTVSNYELGRTHRTLLDAQSTLVSPRLRERIVIGLAITDDVYTKALSTREIWRTRIGALFQTFDILIAPATPYTAPQFTDTVIDVNGFGLEPAKSLGRHTQTISFAGLPVLVAPLHMQGELPMGVQLIGPPGGEVACFAAGAYVARAFCELVAQNTDAAGRGLRSSITVEN